MATYTNTADAVAQAIFANQDISQYGFDDTNDYIGIVPKGTLLGYFYQLAGTQNAQPSLNDPDNQYSGLGNLPWIELNDATNSRSTFYLFGENLFYLPNGSYLSISNTTTPGLPANTYGGTATGTNPGGANGTGGNNPGNEYITPLFGGGASGDGGSVNTGGGIVPVTTGGNTNPGGTVANGSGTNTAGGGGLIPGGPNIPSIFNIGSNMWFWLIVIIGGAVLLNNNKKK